MAETPRARIGRPGQITLILMYCRTHQLVMTALALVTALAFLSGCDPNAKHKEAIYAAWTSMKTGYTAPDSAAVARMLTCDSLDHYGRICRHAMDMPEIELLKQPPTTMLEVLEARRKCTRKELEKLDGAGFVTLVVNRGCWDGASDGVEITSVKVTGDFAQASLYYPELEKEYRGQTFSRALGGRRTRLGGSGMDKPPRYPIRFVKDADGWKFDELSSLPNWDQLLLDNARLERVHLREIIKMVLEEDGEELPKTAWQPLKK